MRILHLFNSFERGGTELQTLRLVRGLCERGLEVHVAAQRRHGPLLDDVRRLNLASLAIFPLTSLRDRNAIVQATRFSSQLGKLRIDVLHTHDFYTNVFGLPCGACARTPVRIGSKRETGMLTGTRRRAERAALRCAAVVLANCRAAATHLRDSGIDGSRIVTIHNGVALPEKERSAPRAEVLGRLGLDQLEARQIVLMVANLRHELKDHPTLLRAARHIVATRPECAFIVAGEGELLHRMRALAGAMDLTEHVHYVGHCPDVTELVGVADVCVLTSRSEGFPNAILEYMAGGRPVVATDVGGTREAVVDQVTGYLVPAGNSSALADRVLLLLNNPDRARDMGERGREHAGRAFSTSRQIDRTCDLYERLLAGQSRAASTRILQHSSRGGHGVPG